MSSFVQKATPFLEHIAIGAAFATMGYLLFWTFNNTSNLFSILGMVAVCFGGLKILIGILIYGGWVFTLIFRPEYLARKEKEELEKAASETEEQKNASFLAKHWGIIVEITLLVIGFLVILITRN